MRLAIRGREDQIAAEKPKRKGDNFVKESRDNETRRNCIEQLREEIVASYSGKNLRDKRAIEYPG